MKVILYMAITVNGLIATEDDNTDWVSNEEWESLKSMIRQTSNMIIGRRTYEFVLKDEEFFKFLNGNTIKTIVMTHDALLKSKNPNFVVTTKTPKEVLNSLKEGNFSQALVAGGSRVNTSFMKDGLIDEIFLDTEPVVLGKGIPIFYRENFQFNLKLLEVKNISPKTIQLHYRVEK